MKLLQILIIFLLIPFSIAQDLDDYTEEPAEIVNIDTSVEWIMQQSPTTAEDAALATLAATKSDTVSNREAVNKLLNLKNKRYDCWPSTSCNVKDTALAIIALSRTGNAISTTWLQNQERSNTEGNWFLQIDTQASGECKISYDDEQEEIQVERGRMESDLCPFSTQLDLNNCLEKNLLTNKDSLDITVSCGPLGTGKISLVYKIEDKYFIIGEVSTNVFTTFSIKNTDFGDYESTLYAAWMYKKLNKDISPAIWLRRFYQPNIESSSLMYLITEDDYFIEDLLILQNKDTGSFGNVYETSLATLALRTQGTKTTEIDMAKAWLETQMFSDGSWNKDIRDTAMAVYGAFTSIDIDIQPRIAPKPKSEKPLECNENGLCEIFLEETSINCPSDCSCGDRVCDDSESDVICPEDCEVEPYVPGYEPEEGRGFLFYLFIFIILAGIIGGLGYFYYKYYYLTGRKLFKFIKPKTPALLKKSTPKQPVRRQYYQPTQPKRTQRKTLAEKQLEKSLEEARKLIGKK